MLLTTKLHKPRESFYLKKNGHTKNLYLPVAPWVRRPSETQRVPRVPLPPVRDLLLPLLSRIFLA